MIQRLQNAFPWGRIAVVLILAVIVLGLAARNLKTQLPDTHDDEKSAGYGCPEDAPLPDAESRPFRDATDEIGLTFSHAVGPPGTYYVPESVGSGAAWYDFDSDGHLDLLLINGERSPKATGEFAPGTQTGWALYQGQSDGTLKDVSSEAALNGLGFGMGVAVGDVDNDGDGDVYVTCVKQDRLLLNEGQLQFRDIAVSAGISETEWGTGVSFFDYDRDGLLDIVVANYTHDDTYDHQVSCGFSEGLVSYCGPHKFSPTVDRLYHNDGLQQRDGLEKRQPHFTDVTVSAGLAEVTSYGFTAVTADMTGDDWPDILIANDSQPNRFWVNQRNGTFLEQAAQQGIALNGAGASVGSMGIAFGDIDRNQSPDVVISTLSTESTIVFQNAGKGFFQDITPLAGLNRVTVPHTGWGAALVDLDHDGWLDLPLVNGLVIPCHSRFAPHGEDAFQVRSDSVLDSEAYWNDYADRNLLIMSTGSMALRDATGDQGGDFTRAHGSARCLLHGDPDNDGDIDLLVTNSGSRARFYRNEFPKLGHWTRLKLWDSERKRDAIGAQVTVECGNDRWTASVTPYTSFLASNDVRVHLGIGTHSQVDRIIVRWPDGPVENCVEEFAGGPVDTDRQIVRGQGKRLESVSKRRQTLWRAVARRVSDSVLKPLVKENQ